LRLARPAARDLRQRQPPGPGLADRHRVRPDLADQLGRPAPPLFPGGHWTRPAPTGPLMRGGRTRPRGMSWRAGWLRRRDTCRRGDGYQQPGLGDLRRRPRLPCRAWAPGV